MTAKRGFSHVEAIISFVIFIAFLVFAFVFFSPFQSGRTLRSTSDYAWREVAGATEQPLEIYSVVINPSASMFVSIAISGTPSGWNAIIVDNNGDPVLSYTKPDGTVHFNREANTFVRLKFAQDFPAGDSSISGNLLNPATDYEIS